SLPRGRPDGPRRDLMPRDTRTRRLTRPATGDAVSAKGAECADTAPPPLVSLLARTSRLIDLLPHLHQHAIDVTGGDCSLLFEFNPGNGVMQATSGFGLDELRTDPWSPGQAESAVVTGAFGRPAPTFVADAHRDMPDLAGRLGTSTVLLLPLAHDGLRTGLLAVGFHTTPAAASLRGDGVAIGDAFLAALELFRLRQREELQRDLRDLLDEFATSISVSLNLAAGLDIFCHGANRLFAADRTSVWVHDRRARHLVLRASSDPEHLARDVRVSADDPLAPAAVALRRSRAEILPAPDDGPTSTVTVPLRGCRRALGTIVFDGVRVETGGELDLLDRADELGRQLSNAIENMQLLDDVIRSRRQLENAFDSLAHLIAVCDRRGRVVHLNRAFAERLQRHRDELLDRSLTDIVGPPLAGWLQQHAAAGTGDDGPSPLTIEVYDPVLKGQFLVTVTHLMNQERERAGIVIVARDLTPEAKLEEEREALRKRLTQTEKLGSVCRRDRARAEQPSAGGAGSPGAADGDRRVPEAAPARSADHLPRSGSGRQDRAQPARVRRLSASRAALGQPPRRAAEGACTESAGSSCRRHRSRATL
ncbi:MAG: hypothetical protein DMG01_29445, partial [Acidobacteria bacterium]